VGCQSNGHGFNHWLLHASYPMVYVVGAVVYQSNGHGFNHRPEHASYPLVYVVGAVVYQSNGHGFNHRPEHASYPMVYVVGAVGCQFRGTGLTTGSYDFVLQITLENHKFVHRKLKTVVCYQPGAFLRCWLVKAWSQPAILVSACCLLATTGVKIRIRAW